MMLLRARSLAMGFSGAAGGRRRDDGRVAQRRRHADGAEHGSLGAAAISRRSRRALVLLGEGEARRRRVARRPRRRSRRRRRAARAPGQGGPRADQRHGRHARHARLAFADLDVLLRSPTSRGRYRRSAARHRPGVRRGPRRHAAASGQAASAANSGPARRIADRGQPPPRRRARPGRLLDALHPQVHGAARDTLEHAREIAERELALVIDNPVVLPDGRVESNGNFHGAPGAAVADFLAIAVADVGAISERRIDRLLDRTRSRACRRSSPPTPASTPG